MNVLPSVECISPKEELEGTYCFNKYENTSNLSYIF